MKKKVGICSFMCCFSMSTFNVQTCSIEDELTFVIKMLILRVLGLYCYRASLSVWAGCAVTVMDGLMLSL